MGIGHNSGQTEDPLDGGINRRGLVGSLTKGAVAGAMLAGMASTALADPVKTGGTAAPAHEQIRNLLAMYSFLLDAADYAKWGQLFGEKGTLELNGAVWAQADHRDYRRPYVPAYFHQHAYHCRRGGWDCAGRLLFLRPACR